MQSIKRSLWEQIFSTAVGFGITLLVYEFVIDPIWHLKTSFFENLGITAVFTVVSVARGFFVRRFFNSLDNKKNNNHVKHSGNHG